MNSDNKFFILYINGIRKLLKSPINQDLTGKDNCFEGAWLFAEDLKVRVRIVVKVCSYLNLAVVCAGCHATGANRAWDPREKNN